MKDVVILAAGQGTRLRPLTFDRPKSMLAVAGQPLLHHLLADLKGVGVDAVTMVVGHGADAIQSFVGDGTRYGLKVRYERQAKQLGPGHALMQAVATLRNEEVVMLPADAWYAPGLLRELVQGDGPALLRVADSRSARHGVPIVRGREVLDLEPEGPESSRPSGGAYRLPRRLFESLPSHQYKLRDALRTDIHRFGEWSVIETGMHDYVDVITVQDILDLGVRLLERVQPTIEGTIEPGVYMSGAVHVGRHSIVRSGCVLQGPLSIGENCDIGPGSILQAGTAVRNHVRIQPMSLLSQCVIGSNVDIGSHSRIKRAYIDRGARLDSGVHLAGDNGIAIGADAILEADCKITAGGVIGHGARVAAGRVVHSVPDGGVAV